MENIHANAAIKQMKMKPNIRHRYKTLGKTNACITQGFRTKLYMIREDRANQPNQLKLPKTGKKLEGKKSSNLKN